MSRVKCPECQEHNHELQGGFYLSVLPERMVNHERYVLRCHIPSLISVWDFGSNRLDTTLFTLEIFGDEGGVAEVFSRWRCRRRARAMPSDSRYPSTHRFSSA